MKKILGILLAIIMVLNVSVLEVSARDMGKSTTKEDVHYLALGDSIADGVGASDWTLARTLPYYEVYQGEKNSNKVKTGYVDMVASQLDKNYEDVQLCDLSVSGTTSGALLIGMATIPEFSEVMAQADIITISIGGADMLQLLYQSAAPKVLGGEIDLSILEQGGYESLMNIHLILNQLAMINPNAEIYVTNLYNTFWYIDYDLLDAQQSYYVNQLLCAYNQGLANLVLGLKAQGMDAHLIDVYSDYACYNNPKKPLVHEIANEQAMTAALTKILSGLPLSSEEMNYLHPTDLGYQRIFRMIKSSMR